MATIANNVEIAATADPFEFDAHIENGVVKISSHMPSAKLQSEFEAELNSAIQTQFTLASGGPSASDWRDMLTYSARLLNHFDQGEISVVGLTVSFSGRAKDQDSYRDLSLIANAGFPDKLKRGETQIIPPYEQDYFLNAVHGESGLVIGGFVPQPEMRDRLAQMGANVDDLRIASGAPDGFTDDSLLLIEQLRSLEQANFR